MSSNEISLEDAVEFIVDNRGKSVPVQDEGIPLIATNCINNDFLFPQFINIRFVSNEIYKNWFRSHPEPDDIIITNKGSMNGAICMVPDPVNFCIAQDMVALRAKKGLVYPKYLFAALRSQAIQDKIKNLNVDGVIPHFKKTDFNKLFFPLPKYKQQQTIGDFYFLYSYKIELNRQTNQTLEQMAKSIFQSWFVDFDPVRAKREGRDTGLPPHIADLFPDDFAESELGMIPKGWEVRKVEEILERLPSKVRYTKDDVKQFGQIPVFEQGANILLGYHDGDPNFLATPSDPAIIFGDHTCIMHLACEPFDISQNVIPLKGRNRSTIWVYYAVRNKQTFQEYRRHWMELISKDVIVPSNFLCKMFSITIESFRLKMEANVGQIRELTQVRDSLLPKLLSGEITVDEVA